MILGRLVGPLLLAAALSLAQDIIYDSAHNATVLTGTWASGSQHVLTGPGFANPNNMTFTYPPVTGISYSFSGDGHYEIARYRYSGNGSQPACIIGVINFVHGNFTLNGNGSITLTPFADGYQEVRAPCAATSSILQAYADVETILSWQIILDAVSGYMLLLQQYNGPLAPQFLVSPTPNMLPTQLLRNVTGPVTTTTQAGLTTQNLLTSWAPSGYVPVMRVAAGAVAGLGLLSLVL